MQQNDSSADFQTHPSEKPKSNTSRRSQKTSDRSRKWVNARIGMQRYKIGKVLARGAFSRVYYAESSKFLLGEDVSERKMEKIERIPSQRRTKSAIAPTRLDYTLRDHDMSLPIPEQVAIKVVKIKLEEKKKKKNSKLFGGIRKKSIESILNATDRRASILVEKRLSEKSLKTFREKKNRKKIQARRKEDIQNEIKCLRKVRQQRYCVYLHDIVYFNNEVWLVMDYEQIGDINRFLRFVFKKQTEIAVKKTDFIKFLMCPILIALKYLHNRGMIHRDVKGANILITRHGIPKLCDFGLVQQFEDLPVKTDETFAGTPIFVPPEVYVSEKLAMQRRRLTPAFFQQSTLFHDSTKSQKGFEREIDTSFDTWSVALTMLSLLYGCSPWEYTPTVYDTKGKRLRFRRPKFPDNQLTRYLGGQLENEVKLYGYERLHKRLFLLESEEVEGNASLKLPRTIPTKHLPKFSEDHRAFVDFIKDCLKLRVERPSISDLFEHEYVAQYIRYWKRFDTKQEDRLTQIALTGKIKKKLNDNTTKTTFQEMVETVGLLAFKACN